MFVLESLIMSALKIQKTWGVFVYECTKNTLVFAHECIEGAAKNGILVHTIATKTMESRDSSTWLN